MKVYSPSETAELLGIKTATLRKYSLLLEKHNYEIKRNSKKHRYYRDEDVMTLRSVITGTSNGATLEESIINVVNLEGYNNKSNETNNGNEANNNEMEELKEMIHKQSELLLNLVDKLNQQQEYIERRLDKKISHNHADEQIEGPDIKKDKKGFFSRLFTGKDN